MIETQTRYAEQEILRIYSLEELRTIAEHGCITGAAHSHIYYNQSLEFFWRHEDEIEEFFSNTYGEDWLPNFTSKQDSFRKAINSVVWAFIESVAQDHTA